MDEIDTPGLDAQVCFDLYAASRTVTNAYRPVLDALGAAEWPWEKERLETAVRRGYEHLPRSQKRLPLV